MDALYTDAVDEDVGNKKKNVACNYIILEFMYFHIYISGHNLFYIFSHRWLRKRMTY